MRNRVCIRVIQSPGPVDHMAQCLVIEWRDDVEISVVGPISVGIIVITDAYDVGVISRTLQQV